MSHGSSRIPGFYKLDRAGRHAVLEAWGATPTEIEALTAAPPVDLLDAFVENSVGAFALPLGIAVNFLVDGHDVLVPMAVEESSVVAAASNMARLVRRTGGFYTEVIEDLMIGQIQILDVPDLAAAAAAVLGANDELLAAASTLDPRLVALGGGPKAVEVRTFAAEETGDGPVLVAHLLVDCVDAMGANTVNTMCEALAPRVAELSRGRPGLRILSNLADRRRYRATCRVACEDLAGDGETGGEVADRIVSAARFAHYDPYRAATHNKGIMNGVDSIVIATGNDWRAVEAGAHAWAARDGRYRALSSWERQGGFLEGVLEIPLQLGVVGGVTRIHPGAAFAIRLMGVRRAQDLGRIVAAVGLSQNLGALRALATEGIQRGHMRLHRRNREIAETFEVPGATTRREP